MLTAGNGTGWHTGETPEGADGLKMFQINLRWEEKKLMKNEDGKGAREGEQSRGKQEGKRFYKSTDLNSRVRWQIYSHT